MLPDVPQRWIRRGPFLYHSKPMRQIKGVHLQEERRSKNTQVDLTQQPTTPMEDGTLSPSACPTVHWWEVWGQEFYIVCSHSTKRCKSDKMVFYRTEGHAACFTAAESVSEDKAQTHTKQEIRVAAVKACQSISRKETACSDDHGRYSSQTRSLNLLHDVFVPFSQCVVLNV